MYIEEVKLNKKQVEINFTNTNNQEFTLKGIAKSLATNEVINKSIILNIKSNINYMLSEIDVSKGLHFVLYIDENVVYDNILFDINEVLV